MLSVHGGHIFYVLTAKGKVSPVPTIVGGLE